MEKTMGMEVGDSDHCASPPPMPEEGGGGGEATIAMMITMMPIVLRTPVQEGGGRRCCLPWQSRRNVSILSLVDTADNNDGKLVVKQPKGKENNADYCPRHQNRQRREHTIGNPDFGSSLLEVERV